MVSEWILKQNKHENLNIVLILIVVEYGLGEPKGWENNP